MSRLIRIVKGLCFSAEHVYFFKASSIILRVLIVMAFLAKYGIQELIRPVLEKAGKEEEWIRGLPFIR